jgi:polyphosphate glucokinase
MLREQPHFDRISAGFPGVVLHGVTINAPNLSNELWAGFELEAQLRELTNKPVRVINDADLQGYGVIEGRGLEMVLTLGTGMGAALFTNGHLVPNLELGHHPFKKNKTYEERICDAELKRIGKARWSRRVMTVIEQLDPIFNYDLLHIGGGNARHIRGKLPKNVRLFDNVDGMKGGIRLWEDQRE